MPTNKNYFPKNLKNITTTNSIFSNSSSSSVSSSGSSSGSSKSIVISNLNISQGVINDTNINNSVIGLNGKADGYFKDIYPLNIYNSPNCSLGTTSMTNLTVTGNSTLLNLTATGNSTLSTINSTQITTTFIFGSPSCVLGSVNASSLQSGLLNVNGNVGIGVSPTNNYTLEVINSAHRSDNSQFWNVTSDITLKKNVDDVNLEECYDKIKKLRLVNFNWKTQKDGEEKDFGLIANEVERIIPRSISINNGFRSIDYSEIYLSLLGTVQKLMKEIEELKK